jgi:hypothetical protein
MKLLPRTLRPGSFGAVVSGFGLLAAAAQTPAPPNSEPVITVRPVVIISMPTEAGKVYQMQASPNLEGLADVGSPIFGDGTPVRQPMASEGQHFFRLKILTEPTVGLAPWSPAGLAYQFNEGQRIVQTTFAADGSGVWQSGSTTQNHSWTWLRSGDREARAELTLPEGTREVLQLTYSAPQAGRFVRWIYRGSELQETDAGSFGPQAPPATGNSPLVPASLSGRSLAFCDQPSGGSLTLATHSTGTRQLEGVALPFHGSWLQTGNNSARLTATFGPTHGEEYRFTFTTPTCGRFTRQTFTEGIFRDADEGTFCLTTAP